MLGAMLVVHGTTKFRDRVGGSTDRPGEPPMSLGRWYATVLSWRPRQLALFVHDPTLLPVLMPLAPAATVLARFPDRLAEILELHDVPRAVIVREVAALTPGCVTPTVSRSIVGVVNEFTHLAGVWRNPTGADDLDELSLRLARVPCSPFTSATSAPTESSPLFSPALAPDHHPVPPDRWCSRSIGSSEAPDGCRAVVVRCRGLDRRPWTGKRGAHSGSGVWLAGRGTVTRDVRLGPPTLPRSR
jgi:hypothetical protein